jgi:hypothetical protein
MILWEEPISLWNLFLGGRESAVAGGGKKLVLAQESHNTKAYSFCRLEHFLGTAQFTIPYTPLRILLLNLHKQNDGSVGVGAG